MERVHVHDNLSDNNKAQRIGRKMLYLLVVWFNYAFFFNSLFDVKK
jgi:hypothetical protein